MALFGRLKEIHGGTEGIATIAVSETLDTPGHSSDAGEGLLDLLVDKPFGGTRPYRLVLEVEVPGRDPFTAEGKFKVPEKAESWSLVERHNKLQPGVKLPVRVDEGDAVRIDWKGYMEMPDRVDVAKQAYTEATSRYLAEQAAKKAEKKARKAR